MAANAFYVAPMPPLVNRVLQTMRGRPRSHDARACLECGERIGAGDEEIRVRGMRVHRRCATYRMRRRGSGDSTLR